MGYSQYGVGSGQPPSSVADPNLVESVPTVLVIILQNPSPIRVISHTSMSECSFWWLRILKLFIKLEIKRIQLTSIEIYINTFFMILFNFFSLEKRIFQYFLISIF